MVNRKRTAHPSLSPQPPTDCPNPESVLKLLPVTILALALSLPTQDREVLAYLIARSIIIPASAANHHHHGHHPNNKCKKACNHNVGAPKGPQFRCGCFDCYTSFWCRWDSSPNRELIHQVIEVFEEHLITNESTKKQSRKGKRRGMEMVGCHLQAHYSHDAPSSSSFVEKEPGMLLVPRVEEKEQEEEKVVGHDVANGNIQVEGAPPPVSGRGNHKCLARKVLPDVVGLFNSRFWSLWSPAI